MDARGSTRGTRRRAVLGLLLVLGNVALVAELSRHALRSGSGAGQGRSGAREARRDLFATLAAATRPAVRGREASEIVIVGDSLVALAAWDELLPGRVVRNRGIAGDTTADLLARVDDAVSSQPAVVVVAAGINDLLRGDAPATVAGRHADIAARIRTRCPQARLLIQAVLPVRRSVMSDGKRAAELVPVLNEKLRALAARAGAQLVDARAALVDARGELDARLTSDGVHLNGAGYLRWREVLDEALGDPNAPPRHAGPGPARDD